MKHLTLIIGLVVTLITASLYSTSLWAEEDGHDHKSQPSLNDSEGEGEGEDHEEGTTEITPEAALKAGIKWSKAQPGSIEESIVLTGQVLLNRDTTVNIRARFSGIVRSVPVKLGQTVKKGDVLAHIESNESLRDYTLTSPISGVILERNTNVGDVTNGEALFVIADLSKVWAKFHVFPKDSANIQEGQKIYVHTLDHKMESASIINLSLPTADSTSQTRIVIVELDNTDGNWRPGLTVNGHVAVSQSNTAIVVPKTALQTMEDQTVLFIKDGNSYEMQPVKTGISDGRNIEITEGLKAGQFYVSEGSFIIKADILKSGAAHEH